MTLPNVFALWDWPTVFGLALVGTVFGWLAVPLAWPYRASMHERPPVLMASFLMVLMFFVAFLFLIVFRYVTGPVAIAERTIGTGLELLVFAAAAGVGLHLSGPSTGSTAEVNARITRAADELSTERAAAVNRLEGAVAENTRITQEASDNATAAYHEANTVNEKIAAHGQTLVLQGEALAQDRLTGQDTNETAHRIDERVP